MNLSRELNTGNGLNGFLGKTLKLNELWDCSIIFNNRFYDKSEMVFWLFGCPSDTMEIKDNPRKLTDTLDFIIKNKEFLKKFKHIVYASSMGAQNPEADGIQEEYNRFKRDTEFYLLNNLVGAQNPEADDIQREYNRFKRVTEFYLLNNFRSVTVLRIPRVYGKGKTKGLFKKFEIYRQETNKDEFDNSLLVKYISPKMFKEWVERVYLTPGIQEYDNLYKEKTLSELYKKYLTKWRIFQNDSKS